MPKNFEGDCTYLFLPPTKAGALIGPWLRLANLLSPFDDLPEVRAVCARIRKLTDLRSSAKGVPVRTYGGFREACPSVA
jgi:hypothetical protein